MSVTGVLASKLNGKKCLQVKVCLTCKSCYLISMQISQALPTSPSIFSSCTNLIFDPCRSSSETPSHPRSLPAMLSTSHISSLKWWTGFDLTSEYTRNVTHVHPSLISGMFPHPTQTFPLSIPTPAAWNAEPLWVLDTASSFQSTSFPLCLHHACLTIELWIFSMISWNWHG